jgi:carbon starvation protein
MNGMQMILLAGGVLIAAYIFYGGWLAKKWGIDPQAQTPAYTLNDGVDYVPAPKEVVFGHQFASIAGAGPINGPIIAAMFGWLPVLLWVLIGGIFFGAVQDFASIYASVKNKGRSIGYLIELYIGKTGKRLFLLFVWLFSILVVAAFADIVAGTFNGLNVDGSRNIAGGSTATASVLFILAAVMLGLFLYHKKPKTGVSTIVSLLLLVVIIVLGLMFPVYGSKNFWRFFIFVYIFFASITPVWVLLQPRDYLNSFLLVAMMAGATIGIFAARPIIHLPAFTGFTVNGVTLFPILFVTIACGAVSGFHSLVASGTSSKQIRNERDMLPVCFGAMLLESFLAVISLVTVGALAVNGIMPQGTPPVIFATAVAGFLAKLGLAEFTAYSIITLAISAFAMTSLDSVARVGRLAFQELFLDSQTDETALNPLLKLLTNKYFATIATLILGYWLAIVGYQNIWPLFGSANQLLSALALSALAVFLKRTKRTGFTLWAPMVIMIGVTFTSLGQIIIGLATKLFTGGFSIQNDGLQLIFAILLVALGFLVAVACVRKLFGKDPVSVNSSLNI